MTCSPPRRWYRPHLTPLCAGLLVVGVLAFLNVPGEEDGSRRIHGWPCTYLVREQPTPSGPGCFISIPPEIWSLTEDVNQFYPTVLFANTTIVLAIGGLVTAMLEWRRRRHGALWRFSLRSAALMVLLLSLPLGWISYQIARWQRVRQVVERLEARGGTVGFQRQLPEWLDELLPTAWTQPFRCAKYIELIGCSIRDDDLEAFQTLNDVETVHLGQNPISNRGLQYLQHLDLRSLSLAGTEIDDEGLAVLQEIKRLRSLNCEDTPITDKGLERIGRLSSLTELTLRNCRITDEGLRHLESLHHLEYLDVQGCTISASAKKQLKARLPQLRWVRDDESDPRDPFATPEEGNHSAALATAAAFQLDWPTWPHAARVVALVN